MVSDLVLWSRFYLIQPPKTDSTLKSTAAAFCVRRWVCFCVFGSSRSRFTHQVKYICFHEQASLPLCDDCDVTGMILKTIKILKMI